MDWAQFTSVPEGVTIWHILDSQFLTSILAASVGYYLLRRERIATQEAEAAKQALVVKERVAEKHEKKDDFIVPPPALQVTEDYRSEALQIIVRAKDVLRKKVNSDEDQRHQRTYANISWHYPDEIAFALNERGQISDSQHDAAFDIFDLWSPYSRGLGARRAVPIEVLQKLRELIEVLEED